jgi:hypothetical protein
MQERLVSESNSSYAIGWGPLASGCNLGFQTEQPGIVPVSSTTAHRRKVCFCVFLVLMFIDIPGLYELFNVSPSTTPPLWRVE